MGIFSLFGKKDQQPARTSADKDTSRKKREAAAKGTSSKSQPNTIISGPQAEKRKVVAQETAMKIDAIESEMSSEFVNPVAPGNAAVMRTTKAEKPPSPVKAPQLKRTPIKESIDTITRTELPGMGATTQFLLNSETIGSKVALSVSEAAPVIEEAAILFANGQFDMVEHVLQDAIQENLLGSAAQTVWNMLFDLYQVNGKQQQFENLSIDYANKFETSPPAWTETGTQQQTPQTSITSATPTVPFTGKLDGNIVKQLERVQNLAANNRTLRLEFARVTEVDPIGCGILLSVLKKLQKSGNDLILVGAPSLMEKIRAILEVGRRDETEAPWLLLLEILSLLNLEKEFEEASIDYCITFEVSPPAFVAPKNKVTTASEESSAPKSGPQHFMMPATIEGRTDQLVSQIAQYAEQHKPAILDCARLTRVDFSAAGQLLTGLVPIATSGETVIEMHNVNHLIAALFNVIGLTDFVRLLPRKS